MTSNDTLVLESTSYYGEFIDRYESCSKKLYITALMILKNPADAEDAVQDTVILAIKAFNSLRNKDSFQPWILKILINRCNRMKFLRFRFNSSQIAFDSVWEDDISDDSIVIRNALLKLDYKYRIVVVLRFFHDLKISQIAEVLKLSEGTVKSQLHRALNQIKDILKGGM